MYSACLPRSEHIVRKADRCEGSNREEILTRVGCRRPESDYTWMSRGIYTDAYIHTWAEAAEKPARRPSSPCRHAATKGLLRRALRPSPLPCLDRESDADRVNPRAVSRVEGAPACLLLICPAALGGWTMESSTDELASRSVRAHRQHRPHRSFENRYKLLKAVPRCSKKRIVNGYAFELERTHGVWTFVTERESTVNLIVGRKGGP